MSQLKMFWSDMDKFPGDAAKIIDQSGSFLFISKFVQSEDL